mmetsp:Transcript_33894/g.73253  ORF Transcript_33894/g.73253 Transcript_33894/m.73253 type:complete len:208 (+) Transcript_33894:552-1175(+)
MPSGVGSQLCTEPPGSLSRLAMLWEAVGKRPSHYFELPSPAPSLLGAFVSSVKTRQTPCQPQQNSAPPEGRLPEKLQHVAAPWSPVAPGDACLAPVLAPASTSSLRRSDTHSPGSCCCPWHFSACPGLSMPFEACQVQHLQHHHLLPPLADPPGPVAWKPLTAPGQSSPQHWWRFALPLWHSSPPCRRPRLHRSSCVAVAEACPAGR